jgi:hypothetical protein
MLLPLDKINNADRKRRVLTDAAVPVHARVC